MDRIDYPVDVRADYPERSSRLWAILTIFWIKFIAVIPHGIILIFLGIAQWVVAFIAQFAVAIRGEYPAGMHEFVTGVLRWQTRVAAFILSVDDRYPPFSLQRIDDYPVDVATERPAEPSRTYAIFTIIVQVLAIAGGIWFVVWLVGHADTFTSTSQNGTYNFRFNSPSFGGSGLVLRQLAAIPHWIVLAFVGIAVFVLWFIVQWVILFVAHFPRGMWDIEAGYVRWYTRVNAYALGLVDRYPPFSMSPSLSAGATGTSSSVPPPPPPMTTTWPQAPAPQTPPPPSPQAPAAPPPVPLVTPPPEPPEPGSPPPPEAPPQP
jgi:Domain of unknown function (DUF4389)